MTTANFPTPIPNLDNQVFWDNCREGRLVLRRCTDCQQFAYPPKPNCPFCASENLEWVESKGEGKVYTYTITRQPVNPAFRERLPWGIVDVELAEGVHMISNLVDFDPEQIEVGMDVAVVFEKVDEEMTLPKFRAI